MRHEEGVWYKSEVENLTLELISKTDVERIMFFPNGIVSMIIGTRDGVLSASTLTWDINDNGVLVIKAEDHQIYCTMKKESDCKDRLYVKVDGKGKHYRITKK